MKKMKFIILTIFVIVFCLQAREVVDVSNSITTSYNINSGEITSIIERKSEYRYDSEGLLKQITGYIKNSTGIFVKNSETEFDVYGNIQRMLVYDSDGNITQENLNINTVNSMGFLIKRQTESYINGNLHANGVFNFEYNHNGDTTKVTQSTFSANGELLSKREVVYEYGVDGNIRLVKTNVYDGNGNLTITINSKDIFNLERLIIISITYDSQGREGAKTESEYNHKGLRTKHTQYTWNNNTNSLAKQSEQVFTYTLKEITPTAINTKQPAQTKNNFQINRSANSLNLNFSDNSERKIEIVNLQGRILNSQSFSTKIHNVDISNLSKNIYVLRIFENRNVNSVKFVKE